VKYESFSCKYDIHRSSDGGFCADNVSWSFDPVQPDLLFEYCQSEFVESEIITTKNFALDQTHMHIGLNSLVNLAATILPGLLVHDDIISRPMTLILAWFEYVHFLSNWAQLFDKLKSALTCALLAGWM